MPIEMGTHRLGPDAGTLQVRTYREGMAAKVGHDLIIEVRDWEGSVAFAADPAQCALELSADPRSLHAREGLRGLKPLSDKDRAEIRKNIAEKVLGDDRITFRARRLELTDDGTRVSVEGDLTIAGSTRPVSAEFEVDSSGRVNGTIPLTQSEWGIKPYRGLMGALKVRDSLEVVLDVTPIQAP
jgi:polyisoprenoid-binding protein YceI